MSAHAATPSLEGSAARLLDSLTTDESARVIAARIDRGILAARDELLSCGNRDASIQLADALAQWASRVEDNAAASGVLSHAGDVSLDARDVDAACEYYERALRRAPTDAGAMGKLQRVLSDTRDWERLETARLTQVEALADGAPSERALRFKALCALAELRAKQLHDVDTAILAYQAALEIDAGEDAMLSLAELYLERGHATDLDDAADLFFKIAECTTPARARSWLERALDTRPDHEAALAALQQLSDLTESGETDAHLMRRMQTFVSVAPASEHRDSIARLLAARPDSLPANDDVAVVRSAGWLVVGTPPLPRPATELPLARPFVSEVPPKSGATKPFVTLTNPIQRRESQAHVPTAPTAGSPPADSLAPVSPSPTDTLRVERSGWTWQLALSGLLMLVAFALLRTGAPDVGRPSVTARPLPATDKDHGAPAPSAPGRDALATQSPTDAAPTVAVPAPAAVAPPIAPPIASDLASAPAPAADLAPTPAVALVAPLLRLSGNLDQQHAQVRQALEPARERLERCYTRARTRAPRLQGLLELGLTLRSDGSVRKVTPLSDSLHKGPVRACAIRALRESRLPTPEGRPSRQLRIVFDFVRS